MLRRLDLKDPWRSLDASFWPDDLLLGRHTVIYGHNGSGKSTLAELLLSVAEGSCATDLVWQNEDLARSTIGLGGSGAVPSMAVFTRKWVKANLSAFLDGSSASSIVTLGREAIDAKEAEANLKTEIEELRGATDEAEKLRKAGDRKVEDLAREVQERIVSELKKFDYDHFTKGRYSIPRVKGDLREYDGAFPDSNAHADALRRLGDRAPLMVAEVPTPPGAVAADLHGLVELLFETPTRVALEGLDGATNAQAWVEQGLSLHEERDRCLFCAEPVSSERRDQLARHFDESWIRIRGEAKRLLASVEREASAMRAWHANLPAVDDLVSDFQPVYEDAVGLAGAEVEKRVAVLEAVKEALAVKVADPSAMPDPPDWVVLSQPYSTTVLAQAVKEHNTQVRRHEEVVTERQQVVYARLVRSKSEIFSEIAAQASGYAEKASTRRAAQRIAERRLDEVRQAPFTTKDMADTLTRDIGRVYGKDHLSVAVTEDGKSYACRRGDEPGTDLSEGEWTTLSLLYFLRKLQDEQTPGGEPSHRTVVIDDPSSSLDREALFATHQWQIDILEDFGQYVILTHDFSLLRLFIKSHKTAWGKSVKMIADGNAVEMAFPRVSFLEMYAATVDGERRSRLGELPRFLRNNTSEYAYLFSMVMAGIADSEDHERLFLLPNAARRVLEIFASYKAPHGANFLQQLSMLVKTEEGEPFRDVYDFCNRYSHGEGSESIDVLDARAVHGHIRRCMEFLNAVDNEHFQRMCQATKTVSTL